MEEMANAQGAHTLHGRTNAGVSSGGSKESDGSDHHAGKPALLRYLIGSAPGCGTKPPVGMQTRHWRCKPVRTASERMVSLLRDADQSIWMWSGIDEEIGLNPTALKGVMSAILFTSANLDRDRTDEEPAWKAGVGNTIPGANPGRSAIFPHVATKDAPRGDVARIRGRLYDLRVAERKDAWSCNRIACDKPSQHDPQRRTPAFRFKS